MATKRKSPSKPVPSPRVKAPAVQSADATGAEPDPGFKTYTVVHTPVAHSGQRYAAGDLIELDEAEAERLGDNLALHDSAATEEAT